MNEYVSIIDNKICYKGIDLGIDREFIQDFELNTGLKFDIIHLENIYNSKIEIIRDKKIDYILQCKN